MTEREAPLNPEPPPFEPQLDLIGDMERRQVWIVDHERQTVRRAPDS